MLNLNHNAANNPSVSVVSPSKSRQTETFSDHFSCGKSSNKGAVKGTAKANQSTSGLRQQISDLQQQITKTLSSISMALDISSAKYASVGNSGFNNNDISSQLSKITDTVETMVRGLQVSAKNKQGCPASGQLQGLNDQLNGANSAMTSQPTAMTNDINDILHEIKHLLVQLQNLLHKPGNYHSDTAQSKSG